MVLKIFVKKVVSVQPRVCYSYTLAASSLRWRLLFKLCYSHALIFLRDVSGLFANIVESVCVGCTLSSLRSTSSTDFTLAPSDYPLSILQ